MYGMAEYEVWRQRPEEIRQEVAAYRLEKTARANREAKPGLWRDLRWELARYAGLFGKRLRNTKWRGGSPRLAEKGGLTRETGTRERAKTTAKQSRQSDLEKGTRK